jgi:hypothetical protein
LEVLKLKDGLLGGLGLGGLLGGAKVPKVSLTFVYSTVTGVIQGVDTLVTPKSVDCLFEIVDYPFEKITNRLKLNLAVAASASLKVSTSASIGLSSGTGLNGVFYDFPVTALANGVTQVPVILSEFLDGKIGKYLKNI